MHWSDIPGWFQWRSGQDEAVAHFDSGSRVVEVGLYLGRSVCSLAEAVASAGKSFDIVGIDTCRGSGPEGPRQRDYHGEAVANGGGTLAGELHRNIIGCGFAEDVTVLISTSLSASRLFVDASIDWVHLDARHDFDSVVADIAAWLPKVRSGGWLSGDDYDAEKFPEVIAAVGQELPDARPWSLQQWRWIVP